ncbi:MAG: glutamate ABC transporter substrate-binding protein [Tetrasphaera sp.]
MNRRALAAAAAALALTGCAGGNYPDTPLPAPSGSSSSSTTAAPPVTCDDPTQSYDSLGSIPSAGAIDDAGMSEIVSRGRLIVGVSGDSYLLGARNPISNKIEGFDIDIAKQVAKALFGDENKITLRVISAADREKLLQSGEIDMVARNMTMTCDRWTRIAFSSEYYHAGQKLLVTLGAYDADPTQGLADQKDKRVCAPTGTTSLAKLKTVAGVEAVTAGNHTGCLVLFQQGKADAITGDDTVLAGLAAQDPYAKVTDAPAISDEPYGLGINAKNTYFVRYVNAVLDQIRADGTWQEIYDKWLAGALGKAPNPPRPVYGRPLP